MQRSHNRLTRQKNSNERIDVASMRREMRKILALPGMMDGVRAFEKFVEKYVDPDRLAKRRKKK